LEPDLRAPDSQPLLLEFALRTLYECDLRVPEMAIKACAFVAAQADLQRGIPTKFASARQYPRAAHWHNPSAEQPSMDRLTGLVGLLQWQGIQHPRLPRVVEACLKNLMTSHYDDAHTIRTAFCLVESRSKEPEAENYCKKLSGHFSPLLLGDMVQDSGMVY
jgi:hypothetical protein